MVQVVVDIFMPGETDLSRSHLTSFLEWNVDST